MDKTEVCKVCDGKKYIKVMIPMQTKYNYNTEQAFNRKSYLSAVACTACCDKEDKEEEAK